MAGQRALREVEGYLCRLACRASATSGSLKGLVWQKGNDSPRSGSIIFLFFLSASFSFLPLPPSPRNKIKKYSKSFLRFFFSASSALELCLIFPFVTHAAWISLEATLLLDCFYILSTFFSSILVIGNFFSSTSHGLFIRPNQ